jgi:hypothetical protein
MMEVLILARFLGVTAFLLRLDFIVSPPVELDGTAKLKVPRRSDQFNCRSDHRWIFFVIVPQGARRTRM